LPRERGGAGRSGRSGRRLLTVGTEHRFTLDRYEGDLAVVVLAGGGVVDLPRWMLPPQARPGDSLVATTAAGPSGERHLVVRVDTPTTARLRGAAAARIARLAGNDPGGDVRP
jgi:hypothetical protein